MKCGFSMEFSTIRSPNRVLTTLKSASKIRILSLFLLPKSSFGRVKIHLEMFVEMFEMEIVEKRGLVADG